MAIARDAILHRKCFSFGGICNFQIAVAMSGSDAKGGISSSSSSD